MYYPRFFVRPFDTLRDTRVENPLDLSVKQAIARPEGTCAADQLIMDSKFATVRPLAPQMSLLDSMYATYKPFGADPSPCPIGGSGRLLGPSLSTYCATDHHMNLIPDLLPQNRTVLGMDTGSSSLTHFPLDSSAIPYHMRIALNQRAYFGPNAGAVGPVLPHMTGSFGASIPHISLYTDLIGDMPSHRHAIESEKNIFCAPVEPVSRFSDHLQRLRDLQQSKQWSTPCCLPSGAQRLTQNACNCCNGCNVTHNMPALIVPNAPLVAVAAAATHNRHVLTNDDSDTNNNIRSDLKPEHSVDIKCVSSAPKLWNPSHSEHTKSESQDSAPDVITLDEDCDNNDNKNSDMDVLIDGQSVGEQLTANCEQRVPSDSERVIGQWSVPIGEDRPDGAVKCGVNVVKQLKDYKPLPKNQNKSSVDGKRHPKQTKTVEVQCDGPDWTPIVLPSKLRNKMSLNSEKRKKCRQKHFHRRHSRSRSSSTSSSRRSSPERTRQLGSDGKSRKRSLFQCSDHNSDGRTVAAVADKMRRCDAQHNLFAEPSQLGSEDRVLQNFVVQQNRNQNKNINTINTISTGSGNECTENIEYEKIIESVVTESRHRYSSDEFKDNESKVGLNADLVSKESDRKDVGEMVAICLDDNVNGMEGKGVKCIQKTIIKESSKSSKQKKTITTVRRRRFRSGLDMIRRKKTRVSHVKDTRNREESKANEEMHSANGSVPTESKRLMVNKALGETLLHRAARSNRKDVVQSCLLSNTSDVNARDNANYTPLHECAIRGHLQIARILLQHGADVEASAAGGIRPIHDAIENNHMEVVRLLLSYGADPNITTYSGATPVQLVRSKAMLKFLTGFLNDIAGDVSKEVLFWKFNGSTNSFDPNQTGFNVFDGLPSDADDDECEHDLVFEVSDTPLAPTYRLPNKGFTHFMRLTDVLRRSGLKRDQFVKKHSTVQMVSITMQELKRAASGQLPMHQGCGVAVAVGGGDEAPGAEVRDCEEMVVLDDKVRSILGIETLRLL